MLSKRPVLHPPSSVVDEMPSWQSVGGIALLLLAEINRKRPKLIELSASAEQQKAA